MYSYSEHELKEAVKNSVSLRQVLIKLNVVPAGGNYSTLKKRIKFLEIDTTHFKGKGWNKNNKHGHKRPIQDYIVRDIPITSHKLRLRLISEGIFQPACSSCNNYTWMNKPIPLELEHKDGNHLNNKLENLCLLCPNCHALTSTYRGRNISRA